MGVHQPEVSLSSPGATRYSCSSCHVGPGVAPGPKGVHLPYRRSSELRGDTSHACYRSFGGSGIQCGSAGSSSSGLCGAHVIATSHWKGRSWSPVWLRGSRLPVSGWRAAAGPHRPVARGLPGRPATRASPWSFPSRAESFISDRAQGRGGARKAMQSL